MKIEEDEGEGDDNEDVSVEVDVVVDIHAVEDQREAGRRLRGIVQANADSASGLPNVANTNKSNRTQKKDAGRLIIIFPFLTLLLLCSLAQKKEDVSVAIPLRVFG